MCIDEKSVCENDWCRWFVKCKWDEYERRLIIVVNIQVSDKWIFVKKVSIQKLIVLS